MSVTPIRRDLEFHLPADKMGRWHPAGQAHSLFIDTLSVFFPTGERFFINSLRPYREKLKDPELLKALNAFIGQEGMHGREHMEYNAKLAGAGIPVDQQEALVDRLLDFSKARLAPEYQLAVTVALEHLTAILGDILLREPKLLEGADPQFAALWRWHALEETEHKAVAFDVYEQMVGKGPRAYAIRTSALVISTGIFWALVYPFWVQNLKARGQLGNWRSIANALKWQWLSPGGLRRTIPDWLDWFKPGFHPWDHDNREFLTKIDSLVKKVAEYQEQREAVNA
jgi:uncharacterized protein